jgi:DNA-binding NarL/FixJ family response regulator
LLERGTTEAQRVLAATHALVAELHQSVLALGLQRAELRRWTTELKARREDLSRTAHSIRVEREERHRPASLASFASLPMLSPRQQDVLRAILAGEANKAIAYELGVSEKTIETHRARIMRKFGATSLAELVRFCLAGRSAPRHGSAALPR